jgi:hypothetical protein
MKTQNGYKAQSPQKMDHLSFAGVMCIGGIRDDRHGRLLNYFAIEFHVRVEKLEYGNCWGWAPPKRISGPSSDYSNHVSGTAIDPQRDPSQARENLTLLHQNKYWRLGRY